MQDPFAIGESNKQAKEAVARRLLGVPAGAGRNDIRKAYRKLARKTHPDHNPEDPVSNSRFIHFTNAYSILMELDERPLGHNRGNANRRPGFLAHMTSFITVWRKRRG